jgi:class 3 adenylate cyclase/tetratricopeptide (TPR) repeat protein
MARRCSGCDATLPAGAKFCSQCGARTAPEGGRSPAAHAEPEAERRQLTAMFCDLAGSTALARRLDPEDLHRLLRAYQQTCAQMIARFDGHVAQYLGDGVLAYFGYPRAHEDDAQRAVRAALAIQEELGGLNERREESGEDPIEARIGIHTGPVVISPLGEAQGRRETLALGDTINIASRIEGLAEPGGVLISDATLRLASGLFVTRDLGAPPLKGVSEPIRVHAVERVAKAAPLMAALPRTPLSGRADELEQLLGLWKRTEKGDGQVATLSGEAGIGKSRIVRTLYEGLADRPHLTIELHGSPYAAGSAFKPILVMLERDLGFAEEDSPEQKLAKLEGALLQLDPDRCSEVVPYLASLLGLPASQRFPLRHMSPELQRQKSLQALIEPVLALARWEPVLAVAEDLHWADPSTLEFLGRLVDETPAARVLLLLSFRPDFAPPWPLARAGVTRIALARLTREETRAIVEAVVGDGRALPEELVEQIAERADGVPLYAEELAKAVVDSQLLIEKDGRLELRGRVSELSIPSTLQGSLMARLDRHETAKRVAQLAATLGRTFPYDLIEAVSDIGVADLRRGLAQLADAEVLFQRGTPPDASYTFKHRLLQDTAYQSQLKSRQCELHARASRAFEERFPQRIAAAPEVVAHHCAAGRLTPQAITYYRQAGELALSRNANQESVDYYARSLELISSLPEAADPPAATERQLQEIALRLGQCVPLSGLRGFEDEELVASVKRCETLCRGLDQGPQRIPALLGLILHFSNAGLLARSRAYADELLEIVEPLDIAPLRMTCHLMRAFGGLTSTAPVAETCADFEKAIALADEVGLPPPSAASDVDAKAGLQVVYAIGLVLSGRPAAGAEMAEIAAARARGIDHPRTSGSVFGSAASTNHFLGNAVRAGEFAREALSAVEGRGFDNLEAAARAFEAWSRARLGDPAGRPDLGAALGFARQAGVVGALPQLYLMAAELEAAAGDADAAFALVEDCQKLYERTGEHGYEGAALLARARAHAARGAPADAFPDIERAMALWSRRGLHWLELEGATLYAELALDRQRRIDEARALLQRVYGTFGEGFELPLLQRARELAARLA